MPDDTAAEAFITRWQGTTASELSRNRPARPGRKVVLWPEGPVEQVHAVADVLAASLGLHSLDKIGPRLAGCGTWKSRLPQMLVVLVSAQEQDGIISA